MKKFLSILMIFAVVLACCACGEQEASQQTAPEEATAPVDMNSAEAQFGHIDQTQPVGGVYKLWNADGVKFIPMQMTSFSSLATFSLTPVPSVIVPPAVKSPATSA